MEQNVDYIAAIRALEFLKQAIDATSKTSTEVNAANAMVEYLKARVHFTDAPELKGKTFGDFMKTTQHMPLDILKKGLVEMLRNWTIWFAGDVDLSEEDMTEEIREVIAGAAAAVSVGDPVEVLYIGTRIKEMAVNQVAVTFFGRDPFASALMISVLPREIAPGEWVIPMNLSFALAKTGKQVLSHKAGLKKPVESK